MSDHRNRNKTAHRSHLRVRSKRAVLQLESPLSIASVGQLKKELETKLLNKDIEALAIDGGKIASADTASLQLLGSLVRWAQKNSIDCAWSEVSKALEDTASILDLTELLQLNQTSKATP